MQIPNDKPSSTKKLLIIPSVFCLGLLVAALLWPSAKGSTNFAYTSPIHAPIVTTVAAFGSLQPKTRHTILAQVSGIVEHINKRPGDRITAGVTILSLANPKLSREADQVLLDLQTEQAELEKLAAIQQKALKNHQAQITLAQYDLTIAKSKLDAQKRLKELSVVSALDLQQADLAHQKAKLILEQQRTALATLEVTQKTERKAQLLSLQRAEKQVELLKKDLENLDISAGIDGVIVKLDADLEEGMHISEGQVLGQIADPSSLYALLRVQATQASLLALQQKVDITLKGQNIEGEISRISPNVDNATIEIAVSFDKTLPNSALSNMAVTANIHITSAQPTLIIDRPEHISSPGAHNIVVQQGNKQPVLQQINVGWVGDTQIEILQGLSVNDQILLIDPDKWQESRND